MTIQVECNDCKMSTVLLGYLQNSDLKGTPFEYLLENKDFNIDVWIDQMKEEGRGETKEGGIFYCDGIPLKDEYDRFFENGEKCPHCNSQNTQWY